MACKLKYDKFQITNIAYYIQYLLFKLLLCKAERNVINNKITIYLCMTDS